MGEMEVSEASFGQRLLDPAMYMIEAEAQSCSDQRIIGIRIVGKPGRRKRLTFGHVGVKSLYLNHNGNPIMNTMRDEPIHIGSISMQFLVDGRHTGGHMAMAEMIVQPGARVPPPHRHVDVDETVHVLEGSLAYRVDDTVRVLNAGDHCFSPRGSVHHFSNPGDVPVRALVVFSPANIGPDYFREVSAVLGRGGPPDISQMKAVMQRHGLELAP